MLSDPEELRDARRELRNPDDVAAPAAPAPAAPLSVGGDVPSAAALETAELLARLRAGDDLAPAQRWLAIVRGDRRPATAAELEAAIATVAADEGVDAATVRAGIDRLLASTGGIAAWSQRLRQRPRPGRASCDAKEPDPLTPADVRRQLRLLPRTADQARGSQPDPRPSPALPRRPDCSSFSSIEVHPLVAVTPGPDGRPGHFHSDGDRPARVVKPARSNP